MKRRSDALDEQSAMRGGALLWQAWRDGREIDALPADCRPRTIGEAYAVQDGLAASAGMAVAGDKVGATNAREQARFGVDAPFSGRVFADFVGERPLCVPAGRVNFHKVRVAHPLRPRREAGVSSRVPPLVTLASQLEALAGGFQDAGADLASFLAR